MSRQGYYSSAISTVGEYARGEWKELARRYGPNRAAWILQSLREGRESPYRGEDEQAIPKLFLMPERSFFSFTSGPPRLSRVRQGRRRESDSTAAPSEVPPPFQNGMF